MLTGTLWVEAFSIGCIMTMLEENNGLAIRLEIYNLADSQTKIKSLYPMGAKFTIREPISSIEYMLSFSILINNPANFEMHVT